jgi:uridine kinase
MKTERPFVLAVCGPSGGGKSTLIEELVRRRQDATWLALDEYEAVSVYPDTDEWLAAGADPNGFESPQFVADLAALVAGRAVALPEGQGARRPGGLILVEEPFGRGRSAVAPLLDAALYVDIPAEVALARKLQRRNAFFPWEQDSGRHLAHLREFLAWYLRSGRAFAQAIERQTRPTCDLVVDGLRPTKELADVVFEWIELRQRHAPRS